MVPALQNFPGVLAYAVLHAACYLPPLLLRSPEAWIRACSTMSSCSSSTNKSSRRWTLDCPCCAEPVQRPGSPGSWTSAACASPSAPIPWAARQKEKGKSKTCVFILFFFIIHFAFVTKALPRTTESHSFKRIKELNAWASFYSLQKLLGVESCGKFTHFIEVLWWKARGQWVLHTNGNTNENREPRSMLVKWDVSVLGEPQLSGHWHKSLVVARDFLGFLTCKVDSWIHS